MNFSVSLLKIAVAGIAIGTCIAAQADATATAHWNYENGAEGPVHWGDLEAGYALCASGKNQSPVDIRNTTKGSLPDLQFNYAEIAPTFFNNGHTIQIMIPAGQTVVVGDQSYELLQFHFHTPSEEAINGKHTAMVAHFVHKNAAGELGVVAVLLKQGKHNPAFDAIFAHLPRPGEKITVDGLKLNLAAMLPTERSYYSLTGSLTIPPCSEGVNWMIMKQPVTLGADQIRAFQKLYKMNARPIQPLNDRVVTESK